MKKTYLAKHDPPSNVRILDKGEDPEGVQVAADARFEADLLTHGWRTEFQRHREAVEVEASSTPALPEHAGE